VNKSMVEGTAPPLVESKIGLDSTDKCRECGRYRGLIDSLCDDCTIRIHGELFPWLLGMCLNAIRKR